MKLGTFVRLGRWSLVASLGALMLVFPAVVAAEPLPTVPPVTVPDVTVPDVTGSAPDPTGTVPDPTGAVPDVTGAAGAPPAVGLPAVGLPEGTVVTSGTGVPPWEKAAAKAKKACKKKTKKACKTVTRVLTATVTNEQIRPFAYVGPNPCISEAVAVEGQNHMKFTMTLDSSGGIHTVAMDWSFQGSGVGVMSGKKYSAQERQWQQMSFPGPTFEASSQFRIHFVRAGEAGSVLLTGDDFYSSIHFHMTSNANGETTSEFMKIAEESQDGVTTPFECR